ncbi:glycoside hydrolase family 16 protein [Nocardioides jishulii]|uniref:Glycoside hydrolase family 16 protein n=1 Tax=Nocardioides jishulii TaxID=2575440 RepID=A0A4U2YUM9_9ACTN|nr:glycoside hydrolase family 16 protein [Nocardioides jishulii]QCX28675.1 glycoside hydrolase family 16 protein [Nocardioides jishulii]TKI64432.1 glycoside hydrolase family 16 protein [Nocardioides jishulii]
MNAARLATAAIALLLPAAALTPAAMATADRAASGLPTGPTSSSSGGGGISPEAPSAKPKKKKAKKKKKGPKVWTKAKKVTIRIHPQIAHPGTSAATASAARVPVEVTVLPKRRTAITLQVKAGKKWVRAASAVTAPNGTHLFRASATRGKGAATYRVVVGKRASSAGSTARWLKPSFSDNFSGGTLSSAWNHRGGDYNPASRSCSRGDASAVKVSGGVVRLSVLKDPSRTDTCTTKGDDGKPKQFSYRLNGHIGTKGAYSFTYGYAAARVKFPKERGQHGAFWLQVEEPDLRTINPRINGSEIDVIESYGLNAGKGDKALGLTTGVHRYSTKDGKTVTFPDGGWVKNANQYLTGKNDSYHGGYHVFSVEWTPTYYVYRLDGKEYWRSSKGISGTPQFPVLSLLSSDYELDALGSEARLPQHMYVDWLRVWETHP